MIRAIAAADMEHLAQGSKRLKLKHIRNLLEEINQLALQEKPSYKENLILLGPPGVGKSHLAITLGVEAVNAGYSVLFITMDDLAARMYACLADNSLPQYMRSFLRNDLIILDEVGYLTLDKTASDHLFQLVNKAYERVSLIVTSNLDFAEWGTLFASPGNCGSPPGSPASPGSCYYHAG